MPGHPLELRNIRPLAQRLLGFPGGSAGKESTCNAGDLGSIPELERSPGEGKGCALQYSCLVNPMGRGAWRATVQGVTELDTTERPSLCHSGTHSLSLAHVLVAQSCAPLCDPVDCSPPGSSAHGILQAGKLEGVAISISRGLPNPGIIPASPAMAGRFFTPDPPGNRLLLNRKKNAVMPFGGT